MHLTLIESDRSFLRSAECASISILAHAGLVWLGISVTAGGSHIPTDEREARVFFLLPPDRVDARRHQTEVIRWGKLGGDLGDGPRFSGPPEVGRDRQATYGSRAHGKESGARGELPFGPPAFLADSAYSVLQVDQMVERYEGSAAPIYPRDLAALGTEGQVHTSYVVDETGRVDTSTVHVLQSDDPRFTESVRVALGGMRFRPAKRGGKAVRQLVEQRFKFRLAQPARPQT